MPMTNFKLFGTEIIVNATPDSTTDEKVLVPAKEESITTSITKPIFSNPNPNPNPNPSSSSGVSTELGLGAGEVNNNNNGDEWGKMMIKKRLTCSDLNELSRLMVSKKAMEERVISLMREEMRMSVQSVSGLRVEMVDDDTGHTYTKWCSNCGILVNVTSSMADGVSTLRLESFFPRTRLASGGTLDVAASTSRFSKGLVS